MAVVDQRPAAVVSPFDYSRLIWATTLGYLIFGNLPDGWTILGATVIVGAGLYVYRRESRTVPPAAGGRSGA